MPLKSRDIVLGTTALAMWAYGCSSPTVPTVSSTEPVSIIIIDPPPKSTPTPTAYPYTWYSLDGFATAINATANAVETQMPPEMPDIAIKSYRDLQTSYSFSYSANGKNYFDAPYGSMSSGSVVIDGLHINGDDYVLFSMSGHQLSIDIANQKFTSTHHDLDYKDGKPLVAGKIESFGVLGNIFNLDNIAQRSVYNSETGEDWGFVMFKKADITDPRVYEGALKPNQILFSQAPANNNFFGLCKPTITGERQVVTVNAKSVGEYGKLMRIKYMTSNRCSGSAVFYGDNANNIRLVGPVSSNMSAKDKDGNIFVADEALVYPVFSNLGQAGFEKLLLEMASEIR